MDGPYLLGVVSVISLSLLVYLFDGKRVLRSVVGLLKATFFDSEFPDYSALSGVPLPGPLKDFDVDKAKPRPYRPFRWNYIQNMGMSSAVLTSFK